MRVQENLSGTSTVVAPFDSKRLRSLYIAHTISEILTFQIVDLEKVSQRQGV